MYYKISCLIVTQVKRLPLLEQSLLAYKRQTYPTSLRELVIVHCEGEELSSCISQLLSKFEIIGQVHDVEKCSLGQLRNYSVQFSSGDILCIWDDDDFYHSSRLEVQSLPFKTANCIASTIGDHFMYFSESREIYVRRSGKEGLHGPIMYRQNLNLSYQPNLNRGEDTELIRNILLYKNGFIERIDNHPELVIRVFHGLNTWDYQHWEKKIKNCYGSDWLILNHEKIRSKLIDFGMDDIIVMDNFKQLIFKL